MFNDQDTHFMQLALKEAQNAYEQNEIPIGAIVVIQDKIIAKAHNQTELLQDVTAHAEMLALTAAFHNMGSKILPNATLYVTLQPCTMCAGALYWSRVHKVIYAATDHKNGFHKHCHKHPFHPKTIVQNGIMSQESITLLQDFFNKKRNKIA